MSSIGMDFFKGLSAYGKKNASLFVVDRMTAYRHFLRLRHPYNFKDVDEILLKKVYKFHGLPKNILLDRHYTLKSHFWKHYFKSMEIKINLSTSYHP